MRRAFLRGVLSIVTVAVASPATAKEGSLVPPAQSTRESRQADVQTCLSQAEADVSELKPLDDDALLLLQGHRTEGFVSLGQPSLNHDYVPKPSGFEYQWISINYGPPAFTNRYVVCLLKKGYRWQENAGDSAEPAPPHDAEPARKRADNTQTTKIVLGYSRQGIDFHPGSRHAWELAAHWAGYYPQGIAFTPGAVWVTYWVDDVYLKDEREHSGVFRVDPNTNKMVTTVRTGKQATGAAAGEGGVWIGNFGENSVSRIDPETNRVAATIAVGKDPVGLDVGEGSVWVANARSNTVSRIDPKANAVIATIPVGKRPEGIAFAGGSVWVANFKSKSVSRIDPKTNAVVATIEVEGEPTTVTARGSDVWVSCCENRSGLFVQRIDANSNRVVARTMIAPGGRAGGAALLDDALWVADEAHGALWRIDIRTNAVTGGPIPVGCCATILGVGRDENGAIWLSNNAEGMVRKVKP